MYLDAPSLVYRAFFGVPNTIKDRDGRPVNAVRGFLDMLATLNARRPDEVVAVFDAEWRPQFRVDQYAGYKSERPDEPPELTRQFELLPDILDAAGVARAEAAGFEADDAIATLCAAVSGDDTATVVTGDRDLLCLVRDPHVSLLFTVRGVTDLAEFDEAAVAAKYGVPPSQYCEFAMLRGDSSDGLPGVPGVGPVTAVTLLKRWGSIDGIYEHLDELPLKQRLKFKEAHAYLDAVRGVVVPVYDAPLKRTEKTTPDEPWLRDLAEQHNLEGPVERLLRSLRADERA